MTQFSPTNTMNSTAILDLEPLHPKAYVLETQRSCIRLELDSVRDLITVACDRTGRTDVPPFTTVWDRLEENEPVTLFGSPSIVELPKTHVQRVLREFTVAVRRCQTPGPSALVIVISSTATDLQRKRLLDYAFEAGWRRVQLCNRTDCVGRGFLGSAEGDWLVLATSYGPSELSIIRNAAGSLTPVQYFRWDDVSKVQLERQLIQLLLEAVGEMTGTSPTFSRFGPDDWHWLRRRANLVGQKLNLYDQVEVEVPGELSGHSTVTIPLQRAAWLDSIKRLCRRIALLTRSAIDATGINKLRGCVVSGDLVGQSRFLHELRAGMPELSFLVAPSDVAIEGVCKLMHEFSAWHSPESDSAPTLISPPPSATVHLADPPSWRRANSEQERTEILASFSSNRGDAATDLKTGSPTLAQDENLADIELRKTNRRKRGAKHNIKMARLLLDEQDLKSLDQAVQLSHQANENHKDEQTFRDVIDVHLKAATSRPPRIETFESDSRWLLCAFGHDPTDAMQLNVVDAICQRYLTHVEQLTERHTVEAATEACRTLEELLARVPCEQADEWLGQLKSSNPERVVCKRSN